VVSIDYRGFNENSGVSIDHQRFPALSFIGIMKRIADICVAVTGLLLSLPVLLLAGMLILVSMGRPIFFCHQRPGLHGKPFKLIKFRTMTSSAPDDPNNTFNAVRITRVGRWLRDMSIDELPSLWNVLVGDMSLIGPRPLRMEYLELYNTEQHRRHHVKPGLTGLAQVKGRNLLTWDEKFQLDLEYVDHRSWRMDMHILLATLPLIFRRVGIYSSNGIIETFKGDRVDSE
jgi:lipopolysaccharide/colanic/teichoic acid biosynthesis glycosyltransferase